MEYKSVILFCSNDIGYEKRTESLEESQAIVEQRNKILENQGNDDIGSWRAMSFNNFLYGELLETMNCYDLLNTKRKY